MYRGRLESALLALAMLALGCRGLRISDDRLLCGEHGECPAPYQCNSAGRCGLARDAGPSSDARDAEADLTTDAVYSSDSSDQAAPDVVVDHEDTDAVDAKGDGQRDTVSGPDLAEAGDVAEGGRIDTNSDAPNDRAPAIFLLSVAIEGPAGAGTVLSTTAGVSINCGVSCSALVAAGTSVQLVASPSASGSFGAWTGCSPSNQAACTVVVNGATNVQASFTLKNGVACGQGKDCASSFCVSNVCCAAACNGPCDASCQSGTCSLKPVRTACGKQPGPGGTGAASDVTFVCDSAGRCGAPTIVCSANAGDTPCNLTTMSCCGLSPIMTGGAHMTACTATASCAIPADGDFFNGYSCVQASDCPLTQSCCAQTLQNGGHWAVCKATCDTAGGDVPLP